MVLQSILDNNVHHISVNNDWLNRLNWHKQKVCEKQLNYFQITTSKMMSGFIEFNGTTFVTVRTRKWSRPARVKTRLKGCLYQDTCCSKGIWGKRRETAWRSFRNLCIKHQAIWPRSFSTCINPWKWQLHWSCAGEGSWPEYSGWNWAYKVSNFEGNERTS